MTQQNNVLLVTGAAGFIGSHFVRRWLKQHPEDKLVILDALTYAGNVQNLKDCLNHPNLAFVQGDICDPNLVKRLLLMRGINKIVHFAAESHVDRSIAQPDTFVITNVLGTQNLLNAAKEVWLNANQARDRYHFHHVSTDEVYGSLEVDAPAFREQDLCSPRSPYSASKAAADHLVMAYSYTYGLNTSISRCSNNYGPNHHPEKFIPKVITHLLQDQPVPIYGNGDQIRDWIHVEDHVIGIEKVITQGRVGEIYNLGGGKEISNLELAKIIVRLVEQAFAQDLQLKTRYPQAMSVIKGDADRLLQHVADRPGHDWRYALDCSKAHNELGFKPQWEFMTGLSQTVHWYMDNPGWWCNLK